MLQHRDGQSGVSPYTQLYREPVGRGVRRSLCPKACAKQVPKELIPWVLEGKEMEVPFPGTLGAQSHVHGWGDSQKDTPKG